MGTKCLTVIKDNGGKEICVLYRQMDGYLEGHGMDLAIFLQNMTIINGISSGDNSNKANGMDCLAAQIIAYFKDGIGSFYLYPANTRNCGEEYIYEVYLQDKILMIRIINQYAEENDEQINVKASDLAKAINEITEKE